MAGLVAFVLLGCPKKADGEIKVGAYLSLSGPDSTFGSDTREGIELAVTELNAKGGIKGKKVRVLYEDDKSRTHEASQKVMQLADRDEVVALLGEAASSRSLAGGLVANTKGVPMITPSSTAVEVTKDREWVFRTCFTDDQQGKAAARFVRETLKRERIAVFYAAQDTYSSGLARTFIDALRAGGSAPILTRAPKIERRAIRDALAQTKDLPGATGTMTVGVDHNTVKPVVVVQIQAKQFRYAGEVAP